ncbi:ComEC/Rec2 family competence protein [Bauldia sp.]|uniref:ComEC/Rec2 family competence protein n=1 Tax=Bauldia sp. TaxID=2575872 RepID=UPI003BA955F7
MSDLDHRDTIDIAGQGDDFGPEPRGWRALAFRIEALGSATMAVVEREMEAGRGFIWLPVLFGAGIVGYFGLPAEPSGIVLAALTLALGVLAWRGRRRVSMWRVLIGLTAIAAGATIAKARTEWVAAPVLAREMTVEATGWIAAREAASRGGVRVLLSVETMNRLPPADWPRFVRITVRSQADALAVGDSISVLARLRPPNGPAFPGGYDFARADFYTGVGAVGFAYGAATPVDLGAPPLAIRLAMPIAHLRQTIRARILAALPGDNGQIAAALVMGDRRGIPEDVQEAMRASGLGHVLAISGLHMALVAGSAFWLLRALLALSPSLAVHHPIRKWAAAGALGVAAVYLAISGGSVSTQRAFIMLAIMLLAVMIDRRAITLRNVAIAALIVLVLEPESVLTASFQMSFAATAALVAGYEILRERRDQADRRNDGSLTGVWGRGWFYVKGLFVTSLIAGAATTPFAVYHFQRAAPLTLIANLLAMPAVALLVMPMALFAVVLMPLGLESLPLTVMGWGLDWVVGVARVVAGWSHGWGGVPAPPSTALLLVVVGFLWLCLWRERWRWFGIIPILLAIPVVVLAPRPAILIDAGGRVAAVRGEAGRYQVIGAKDNRFVTDMWLRADADPRSARDDGIDAGVRCDPLGCTAALADGRLVAVSQERAALAEDCRLAAVVVSRFAAPDICATSGAMVIDGPALRAHGAHALFTDDDGEAPGFRIETAYPANRRPFMPVGGQ